MDLIGQSLIYPLSHLDTMTVDIRAKHYVYV